MRVFHVSEDGGIGVFVPRLVERDVCGLLGQSVVWALDEAHLVNYLFPRDCPRLCFRAGPATTARDVDRFLGGDAGRQVAVIESAWAGIIEKTVLYLYGFEPGAFRLADATAGYWVSSRSELPFEVLALGNLPESLRDRGVELCLVDELWDLREAVIASSLDFSLIRMRNARLPVGGMGRYTALPV